MNNKIKNTDCQNFEKLLPLMIKSRLNLKDYIFFRQHLNKCENCQKKYEFIKKIFEDFKNIDSSNTKNVTTPFFKYSINEYKAIEDNISAYIDNELSPKENLKVKKLLIGNKHIETEFIKINKLIEIIKNDAEICKNRIKSRKRFADFLINLIKK